MARPLEMNVNRRWSEEEDEIIRNAVAAYEKAQEDINWHAVASHLPGRNNKDCRKRWVYNLAPSINKGAWTESEDKLLLEGIKSHGFRWPLVAQVVGSRQPDQCSRRWRESLNPDISHDRWSLQEDETLKEAVQVYGRKWTEIVERFLPNRTPIAAKKRYAKRFQKSNAARKAEMKNARRPEPNGFVKSLQKAPTPVGPGPDMPSATSAPNLLWNAVDYSQSPTDMNGLPMKRSTSVLSGSSMPSMPPSVPSSMPSTAVQSPDIMGNNSPWMPQTSFSDPRLGVAHPALPFQPADLPNENNPAWVPKDVFSDTASDATSWGWNQPDCGLSECASDPGWNWIAGTQYPDTPYSFGPEDPLYYSDPGAIEPEVPKDLFQGLQWRDMSSPRSLPMRTLT